MTVSFSYGAQPLDLLLITSGDNDENVLTPVTAANIGAWLLEVIEDSAPRSVYQSQAVREIRNTFGEEWSYRNNNGKWAISKEVLKEFNTLKHARIQWDRGSQFWHIVSDEKLANIQAKAKLRKQRKQSRKQKPGTEVSAALGVLSRFGHGLTTSNAKSAPMHKGEVQRDAHCCWTDDHPWSTACSR